MQKQPVEPLSHLLSGAMNEAALWLAETDSPDALEDTMKTLTKLLEIAADFSLKVSYLLVLLDWRQLI